MRRRILAAGAVVMCTALATTSVHGQGKGKPSPGNLPVTSQVHDGNDTSLFQLRSDGLGPYVDADGILTQIYATSGDWVLDLSGQAVRVVDLTFTTTDGSPSAAPSGRYNARVLSRCFGSDGTATGFLQIPEGASNSRCSLRVEFSWSGTQYVLVMSPLYAGTSWATVSCPVDTDANSTCERWTIAPDPNVAVPVASLYKIVHNKEVFVGSYVLTFGIDATTP